MKNWRKTKLLSGLIFLTQGVSAQSLDELVGSNLTLEESLVQFINSVTTFQVTTAGEALLYIVTPLIGFYYLILNFVTMAYENFQDEVDRPGWRNTDDEIPTGMKGFAMITSVITVLFLGNAGAGLLLTAGLISFGLALLMFLNLFETEQNNQQPQQQAPQQQQGPQQQQQQQNQTWADALNATANLFGTANNTLQTATQNQQQNTQNQLQESLRYFQNDIISEIDRVRNGHPNVENLINQLESELVNHSDWDPDTFKNILMRAQNIDNLLNNMKGAMRSDFRKFGSNPDFSHVDNNLSDVLSNNNGRGLEKEISGLEGKIERILSSNPANPPADAFNDLLDELHFMVAVAHFMHYSPFSMSEIASDSSKAQKVVDTADSMNKIQSRPDNANKLQVMTGWLDGRSNIVADRIEKAENLCKKEMKIDETEIEAIKELIGKDESIHKKLNFIDGHLSDYQNVPTHVKNVLSNAESKIADVDNMLASLESRVSSQQEYEADIYKKLKELEGKI
jgi:hypothetical protein